MVCFRIVDGFRLYAFFALLPPPIRPIANEDLLRPVLGREATVPSTALQRLQARHQIRRRRGRVVDVGELVGIAVQVVELLYSARVLYVLARVLARGDDAGADGAYALVSRRVV